MEACLKNIYSIKNKNILIVDSLGVYNIKQLKNPIVILQQSPKINLERLIKVIKPSQIIADGSNYKSYMNLWEEVSKKENIPFLCLSYSIFSIEIKILDLDVYNLSHL